MVCRGCDVLTGTIDGLDIFFVCLLYLMLQSLKSVGLRQSQMRI